MATIVTRSGKGSPLTNTEVDTNFTNLNTGLTPIEGPSSLGSAGQVLTVNSGASASEWAAAAGGADLYAANESSPSAQPSATGANAVAIGDGAVSSTTDGIAIGNRATHTTTYGSFRALSIGADTVADHYGIAVGNGTTSDNVIASGSGSLALGYTPKATEFASTAIGISRASGTQSFAGNISNNSTSYGASGGYSLAIGRQAKATGTNSVAIGYNATASGTYSTSFGYLSSNAGYGSTIGGGRSNSITSAGTYSTIAGGRDNDVTGDYSLAAGRDNTASGSYSSVFGYNNTVTGNYSLVFGYQNTAAGGYSLAAGYGNQPSGSMSSALGNFCEATVTYSMAHGSFAKARVFNSRAQAGGRFTVTGDAQGVQYVLRADTTDATATVLTANNSSSIFNNNIISAISDTCITFSGTIVAMQNGAQSYGSWEIKGLLVNDGGTTTLANSAITVISNTSNWGLALSTIDTSTVDGLSITVTGEASHNIRWVANIHTAEVTYA